MEWACNRIKYLSNTKHQKPLNDGKQKFKQKKKSEKKIIIDNQKKNLK